MPSRGLQPGHRVDGTGRACRAALAAFVLLLLAGGCDTVQIKAQGSEHRIDWGVGIQF